MGLGLLKPGAYANVSSTGELQSIDGYMNLALEKCEEYVDGVKKRSYGDAFVRGNNGRASNIEKVLWLTNGFTVMYISAD